MRAFIRGTVVAKKTGRWAWLVAVLAVAIGLAIAAVLPEVAAASLPHRVGQAHIAPGSELSLSRAPAGLRAAVDRTLGAPDRPLSSAVQQAELTASNGATGDELGGSVAISGSTAVIDAVGKNANTGAAYVFVRSGTAWSQQAKLTASNGATGDYFGFSVAISGSTAVAGAPVKNSFTGAAYVFVNV